MTEINPGTSRITSSRLVEAACYVTAGLALSGVVAAGALGVSDHNRAERYAAESAAVDSGTLHTPVEVDGGFVTHLKPEQYPAVKERLNLDKRLANVDATAAGGLALMLGLGTAGAAAAGFSIRRRRKSLIAAKRAHPSEYFTRGGLPVRTEITDEQIAYFIGGE